MCGYNVCVQACVHVYVLCLHYKVGDFLKLFFVYVAFRPANIGRAFTYLEFSRFTSKTYIYSTKNACQLTRADHMYCDIVRLFQ